MFGFASWSDFTEKAKTSLQTLEAQAKDLSLKAKTSIENISTDVTNFIEEQKQQLKQIEHESELKRLKKQKKDKLLQRGCPPWHYESNDNDNKNDPSSQIDELKLRILKLCEDNNNFLIEAPASNNVFEFNFESALPYANCALTSDPILAQKRYLLVPKSILEQQFWRNYFYRVQLIRESMGFPKLDLITPPQITIDNDNEANNDDDNQNNIDEKHNTNDENNENHIRNNQNKQAEVNEGENNNNDTNIMSINVNELEKKIVNLDNDNNNTNVQNNDLNNYNNESKNKNTKINKNKQHQNSHENEDIVENEEFLSDDLHVDALTSEEREKMQQELGIKGNNKTNEDVDLLLDDVVNGNGNDVNISDGEVDKVVSEVENSNI